MTSVSQHIAQPEEKRDLDWLKSALQSAIALEASTIPLYLSAMYSLEIQNYTTYNSIRSVVMEEMVHMAIACNILAAIGGTPRIKDLDPGFPCQGLPGGAEPDLYAALAKLSRKQLQNFLRVEIPTLLLPDQLKDGQYPTIGNFYRAVRDAIRQNGDAVRAAIKQGGTSNQVGDDIGFSTIVYSAQQDPLQQVYAGVDEIMAQGEGSPAETLHADPGSEGEESHYCKFAELYYGRRFQQPDPPVELTAASEPQFFKGAKIPFPEVKNTLMVPKDGYEKVLAADPARPEVEKRLLAFDQAYTGVLDNLDAVWNGPASRSWPTLGQSVAAMSTMRVLACFNIMQHQVPPAAVATLADLYPDEHAAMAAYTDLAAPVFYGPRFRNLNTKPQAA